MKETRITHPNNEDQAWLDLRARNVNSSEVACVFGRGEFMTKRKLWELKAGRLEDDFQENIRTKAGQLLEPGIAQLGAWQLGFKARPFKQYIEIPELRMGSSFDWEIYEWDVKDGAPEDWDPAIDGPIILEIKNKDYMQVFGRDSHWNADDRQDIIAPDGIELQISLQEDLAERRRSLLLVLCGGNELLFGHRERRDPLIQAIRSGVAEFWKSIEEGIAPSPDFEKDHDTLRGVFGRRGFFGSVADNHQAAASDAILRAVSAKENRLAAEKIEKAAKAELMEIAGGEIDCLLDDGSRLSWKPNRRGTFLWNLKKPPQEEAA